MRTFLANVSFTIRLFRRSPGFYALVLILLAGGIGATTAMFSVAEHVLLEPLPFPEPEDLTDILRVDPEFPRAPASAADFVDFRSEATAFEQMTAVSGTPYSLALPSVLPVHVAGVRVTADFFPMLRIAPLLGRLLREDDDRPDAPLVAVISARLWEQRFGSDPGAIGRTLMLNSRPYTLVGVTPHGFAFGGRNNGHVDVWTPLFGTQSAARHAEELGRERGSHYLSVMGRLRHGVTLGAAQAQMTDIARRLEARYPDSNSKQGVLVLDLKQSLVGRQSRPIWILFLAVALVFIVISANVASLMLSRAQGRRAEIATRAALGAAPSTLIVQVLTETAVVFAAGSLLGSALATFLVARLTSALVGGRAIGATIGAHVDLGVLAGTVALSTLLGVLAGLGPALVTARVDPGSVLKQTGVRAGTHGTQTRARALLVVAQIAVAFALLTGSGLATRDFVKLVRTSPGFDPADLATAFVSLPARKYDRDETIVVFQRDLVAAVARLPGVESVTINGFLPLSGSNSNGNFSIEGREPWAPGTEPALERNFVAAGYFDTMRIPVLRGRGITAEDTETSRPVLVLTKATVDRFFPGEDPIGRRMEWGTPSDTDGSTFRWREIVGVVGDVRRNGLDEPPVAEAYAPAPQEPTNSFYVVARTRTPAAVLSALPRLVQTLDPELAVAELQTMASRVDESVDGPQRVAVLLGAFALSALVLATLGLFGLVSHATSERTRELGIRLALGSSPAALVGLVVKGAMRLVLIGLGVGLLLSIAVAREVARLASDGGTLDPAVLAPIPLVLGLAGLVACILPALRAVRTPPASALRYE